MKSGRIRGRRNAPGPRRGGADDRDCVRGRSEGRLGSAGELPDIAHCWPRATAQGSRPGRQGCGGAGRNRVPRPGHERLSVSGIESTALSVRLENERLVMVVCGRSALTLRALTPAAGSFSDCLCYGWRAIVTWRNERGLQESSTPGSSLVTVLRRPPGSRPHGRKTAQRTVET
jgi:hypothetical protein